MSFVSYTNMSIIVYIGKVHFSMSVNSYYIDTTVYAYTPVTYITRKQ